MAQVDHVTAGDLAVLTHLEGVHFLADLDLSAVLHQSAQAEGSLGIHADWTGLVQYSASGDMKGNGLTLQIGDTADGFNDGHAAPG